MARDMPSRPDVEMLDEQVRRELARRSRRSFIVGGLAAGAAVAGYEWLAHAPTENLLQWPLRRAFAFDRRVTNSIFRQRVKTPYYPDSAAQGLRVNGLDGVERHLDLASWKLEVARLERPQRYPGYTADVNAWPYRFGEADRTPAAEPDVKLGRTQPSGAKMPHVDMTMTLPASGAQVEGALLSIDDLRRLPYTEQVTQFRCVEGWSQIVRWGGVRFSDFLRAYPPANIDGGTPKFVDMSTPDGVFHASFDMESLLHPQTLLCYTMGGRPLEPLHGAPLRLAMPLKYGYKQIKQIGRIRYTNERVVDFWEKLGFDWYAGL